MAQVRLSIVLGVQDGQFSQRVTGTMSSQESHSLRFVARPLEEQLLDELMTAELTRLGFPLTAVDPGTANPLFDVPSFRS